MPGCERPSTYETHFQAGQMAHLAGLEALQERHSSLQPRSRPRRGVCVCGADGTITSGQSHPDWPPTAQQIVPTW